MKLNLEELTCIPKNKQYTLTNLKLWRTWHCMKHTYMCPVFQLGLLLLLCWFIQWRCRDLFETGGGQVRILNQFISACQPFGLQTMPLGNSWWKDTRNSWCPSINGFPMKACLWWNCRWENSCLNWPPSGSSLLWLIFALLFWGDAGMFDRLLKSEWVSFDLSVK